MKRYELKYMINAEQTAFLKERLAGHMLLDQYGRTSIASLYYDTPDYRLIRTSVEKPLFKEKIRLRSYGLATQTSPVFLEMNTNAGYRVPFRWSTSFSRAAATSAPTDRSTGKSPISGTITGNWSPPV